MSTEPFVSDLDYQSPIIQEDMEKLLKNNTSPEKQQNISPMKKVSFCPYESNYSGQLRSA